ncbi:MAG TPA: hypothetical protein VM733_15205 [Thermoanaerobaculia bacterium]|nr:hypothetical protein [Thermoanaerobaculia bacterium]
MRRLAIVAAAAALALAGCRTASSPRTANGYGGTGPRVTAVDGGGRPIDRLQIGSSLEMTATDLEPRAQYEFRVTFEGEPDRLISFARVTADARGTVAPFVLWFHSGVVGCSTRPADERRVVRFRTFEDAEQALRGKVLRVTARGVKSERTALDLTLPISGRSSAMVYPADRNGCLLNSLETATGDLYVAGRNFERGESLAISIVPNQRAWRVGDRVVDVSGIGSGPSTERVTADANGRFLVRAWDAAAQRRGAYDIVAQRADRTRDFAVIDARDLISYGSDTAMLLFLTYPPGGPLMDLAGRPLPRSPYFEYADSFATTDDNVWAAVDPTYIPAGHPGGIYAGYHVVAHRSAFGWAASQSLTDVSAGGTVEVMPVKAGCVNGTDTIIWPAPVTAGEYDVVVDFGSTVANTSGDWMGDGLYDSSQDFLDGAVQVGFVAARDPYTLGTTPIGIANYSVDDFFPTLGTASNVDLRATVRYPATGGGGLGAAVAPGAHPLFVIQHGNHACCDVRANGSDAYTGTGPLHSHASCPARTPNHEGYTRLLEILASNGIIAVSIDAYDLTGSWAAPQSVQFWITERADLILKHLEMWSHLNNAANFPSYPDPFSGLFNTHVDMTRISVSGHSRGGEASVVAFIRNAMLPTPFSITSVSSIAPVESQSSVVTVPYFVILPGADGDVSDLDGARIYDLASYSTTKSGIDVYGANHNFFNTVWAADEDESWVPRPDQLPAADQQKLGEAWVAAFVRSNLRSETVYDDMLRGNLTFPSFAGRKVYAFRHESQNSRFETGTGAGTPNATATESTLTPYPHDTSAVRVGWSAGNATYTWTMAATDVSTFEVVSFRVAQSTAAPPNPMSGSQEFQVQLQSGATVRATYTGQFDSIPKPYDRPGPHTVMSTVRIPLHSFIMNNSGLSLTGIDTVVFRFTNPSTGEIYVDDVEFSR